MERIFFCFESKNFWIFTHYFSCRIFGAEFIIAVMVVIGFSFIPAGFMLFLVQERAIKAKHLQFVSGLNPLVYWISNIIWDMVWHRLIFCNLHKYRILKLVLYCYLFCICFPMSMCAHLISDFVPFPSWRMHASCLCFWYGWFHYWWQLLCCYWIVITFWVSTFYILTLRLVK